jgi:hypothetical protein
MKTNGLLAMMMLPLMMTFQGGADMHLVSHLRLQWMHGDDWGIGAWYPTRYPRYLLTLL